MINRDSVFELFYGTKPKISWRMSVRVRRLLLTMQSEDGRFILSMDSRVEDYTLFGHPIKVIAEDKLELVYVFSDGTEKVFKLELSN